MAIGPYRAALKEEELARLAELEAMFDAELDLRCKEPIAALGFGIKIPDDLKRSHRGAFHLRAALKEVYVSAGWERIEFDDDKELMWFHRDGFIPR